MTFGTTLVLHVFFRTCANIMPGYHKLGPDTSNHRLCLTALRYPIRCDSQLEEI